MRSSPRLAACCSPLVRPAVLYGHRDRARLGAGPRALFTRRRVAFGCVVVQYGLPGARADIQPSVRAAKPAESVAEPGGKKLRVVREPSIGDVAAGNIGAPPAVDFFLLGDFLVESRLSGFLWPASSQPKRLQMTIKTARRAAAAFRPCTDDLTERMTITFSSR